MKLALIALTAVVAIAQGYALPAQEGVELFRNVIDDLILRALEHVRDVLKKEQPYSIPSLPEQVIDDKDVNLRVNLTGLKISKADDFVAKHIENNLPNLWAKFEILLPQPHVEGDFQIAGHALGKGVSGTGTFSVDLTSMDQSGKIQMGHKGHGLTIAGIDLDFSLENAKFGLTGLKIDGMTEEQVLDFLNNQLLSALQKNKDEVCQRFAEVIREKGNGYIEGKTLSEVIDWLKSFIGH